MQKVKKEKELVFAETREQFKIWCFHNRRHEIEFNFISRPDQLIGLSRGTAIQLIGYYTRHPDWLKVKHLAVTRGYKLLEDNRDESYYTPSRPITNI